LAGADLSVRVSAKNGRQHRAPIQSIWGVQGLREGSLTDDDGGLGLHRGGEAQCSASTVVEASVPGGPTHAPSSAARFKGLFSRLAGE
jgi:hypothetical protein